MPLKERTKVPQRITGKHTKIGEGIEQNHTWSKSGSRNNKEITKRYNSEIENVGKKSGDIHASITNRIQEIEERISGAEDSIETLTQQSKKMQNAKRS